jgi:hypothetical protein
MGKITDLLKHWKRLGRILQLWKACRIYQEGVREADRKHAKDKHRYYMIWDSAQRRMVSLTYDYYDRRSDSYLYMVRRGRWKNRLTREEMKEGCFYYTPSKWTRRAMPPEKRETAKKEWLRYYMRLQRGDRNDHKGGEKGGKDGK